jgi:hypothetical protein
MPAALSTWPGQQQQAGEREQVTIYHPGQARLRETQIGLDGWQRHVDDGHVPG